MKRCNLDSIDDGDGDLSNVSTCRVCDLLYEFAVRSYKTVSEKATVYCVIDTISHSLSLTTPGRCQI
jgi:hypothetical protein